MNIEKTLSDLEKNAKLNDERLAELKEKISINNLVRDLVMPVFVLSCLLILLVGILAEMHISNTKDIEFAKAGLHQTIKDNKVIWVKHDNK